jgi:hypothetical protein
VLVRDMAGRLGEVARVVTPRRHHTTFQTSAASLVILIQTPEFAAFILG